MGMELGMTIMKPTATLCLSITLLLLLAFNLKLGLSSLSSSSSQCEFPAIFNFGDSNSDTGGSAAAFGLLGPPEGETYFHAPAGRICDGRLIIDFIAESLGLPYVSAYLDAMGSNFRHGANFAIAGSVMKRRNTTLFNPFPLDIQTFQFLYFQQRAGYLNKHSLPHKKYFSQGLYTVDIGQNDLTVEYLKMTPNQVNLALHDIVDGFKDMLKKVYGRGGARYFWIHNTGPLGCLPAVLASSFANSSQLDQFGCAIPLNDLAQAFNIVLKEAVAELRKELPESTITYVDVYSAKYELISQAEQFGFENPLRACCGYGGGKYNFDVHRRCGIMEGAQSCKNPSVMINWDGTHYTEAANKWIFNRIVDGSYSDPPVPLNMACYKQP